jgi:hypothetical protein
MLCTLNRGVFRAGGGVIREFYAPSSSGNWGEHRRASQRGADRPAAIILRLFDTLDASNSNPTGLTALLIPKKAENGYCITMARRLPLQEIDLRSG